MHPEHRGASLQEIEIRIGFEPPARAPLWIAGIAVCALMVAGIVAIARSTPASSASISDRDGAPRQVTASASAQAGPAPAPAQTNRQRRTSCSDCGIVESIRKIEPANGVEAPGSVRVVAAAAAPNNYEITVRFRDGSRTIFNEARSPAWRLGSRVIVVGRSTTVKN